MAVTYVKGHQIVDLANDTNYYFEVAPQGDSQSRGVIVEVLNNGVPYSISSGSTVIIEGKNAGGYNIFNSCSLVSGYPNYIDIPFTNGILSFAGVGKYIVAIYHGTNYINSFPFNIVVTEAPYDIERLEGSDSYEALNMAISKALSANRWWVEEGSPTDPNIMGANLGDYYMDALNGNVYYTDQVAGSDILKWEPLMDGGRQISVQQKVHIRYADDSTGSGMNVNPLNKNYIGVYVTNRDSSDSSVSNPNNYSWSRLRAPITNTTVKYAKTTTSTKPSPSDYTSTTVPTNIGSGEYLWTQVTISFEDGTNSVFEFSSKYGINADFGVPTSSIDTTTGKPQVNVTTDPTSPFDGKIFDFDFKIRGGHWKQGDKISGTGTQTSNDFNENNAVIGDMYLNTDMSFSNTSLGKIYRCIAVTSISSTWEDTGFAISVVSNINDLANTYRFYGTLPANTTSLTLTENDYSDYPDALPISVFNSIDAAGNTYYYHINCKCDNKEMCLKSNPNVTISDDGIDGNITIDLEFCASTNSATLVCVEIIKKNR